MRSAWIGSFLVLAAASLAGCTGNGAGGSGVGGPEALSVLDFADAGERPWAIRVQVIDDAFIPMANAIVGLSPGDFVAETGSSGKVAFGPLSEGRYVLHVELEGYASVTKQVEVVDATGADATITLQAMPRDEPYHETRISVVYFTCWISWVFGEAPCGPGLVDALSGSNTGVDKILYPFVIEGTAFRNLLIETVWRPSSYHYGNDDMYHTIIGPHFTGQTNCNSMIYFTVRGISPLRGWANAGVMSEKYNCGTPAEFYPNGTERAEYQLVTGPVPGSSPAPEVWLDQRVTSYLTFFFHRHGADSFTVLPDR